MYVYYNHVMTAQLYHVFKSFIFLPLSATFLKKKLLLLAGPENLKAKVTLVAQTISLANDSSWSSAND